MNNTHSQHAPYVITYIPVIVPTNEEELNQLLATIQGSPIEILDSQDPVMAMKLFFRISQDCPECIFTTRLGETYLLFAAHLGPVIRDPKCIELNMPPMDFFEDPIMPSLTIDIENQWILSQGGQHQHIKNFIDLFHLPLCKIQEVNLYGDAPVVAFLVAQERLKGIALNLYYQNKGTEERIRIY